MFKILGKFVIVASTLTILLILVSSCASDSNCPNRNLYFEEAKDLPIVEFSTTENWRDIRNRIESNFEEHLCSRCEHIAFAIPFNYNGKKKNIKVLADYDMPYCDKCPIPLRLRQYVYVNLNNKGQLIFEDEIISIHLLDGKLQDFYNADLLSFNNSYRQFYYRLKWQKDSNQGLIDQTLSIIYDSHLKFVKSQNNLNKVSFCKMNNIKQNYPLQIELELGKDEFIDSLKFMTTK